MEIIFTNIKHAHFEQNIKFPIIPYALPWYICYKKYHVQHVMKSCNPASYKVCNARLQLVFVLELRLP